MQWLFLGYIRKLKRGLGLAFNSHFLLDKNVPDLILYQLTQFQCHYFFPSQNIKQNLLVSCYLTK